MTPYKLLETLETWLKTDTTLTYIEAVYIDLYPSDTLPTFENYCICISPTNRDKDLIANRLEQLTIGVDIVCIVRNFNQRLSIIGTESGQVGIMKMIEDVSLSLFNFGEATTNLDIRYDETQPVEYKNKKYKDREGFFREHILPYSVRLKPKIF